MNRIAQLRKTKNLSQKELSHILCVAQNTVCNWEKGNREPDIESLQKLARLFGVSIDYLIGWENCAQIQSPEISLSCENSELLLDDSRFGSRLKILREERGLSQAAFANELGVSQSAVGNWESGSRQPKLDIIEQISDYFGVSVDSLLGRDEDNADYINTTTYIKQRRIAAHIKQEDLAQLLNIDRSTVAKWETGQSFPRTEMLPQLADILGCSINELFCDTENAEPVAAINRIKELRKKSNISQQKLASLLNVHQTAISQWETGRTTPDIETANIMAKLFNVTLEYLLNLDSIIDDAILTRDTKPLNTKKLRADKGYSQQDLAILLDVSRSTVAMWESGASQPDNDTLLRIAAIFDTSVDYLLGRNADKIPRSIIKPSPIQEAYDNASAAIQEAVRKLLDIE